MAAPEAPGTAWTRASLPDRAHVIGYSDLKLQALTDALGVQPSAAYRHIQNRDSLLRMLAKRGFDRWAEEIQTLMQTVPPAGRAKAIARFYLGAALRHPQMFRRMFESEYGRDHRSITGMIAFLKLEAALSDLMPGAAEEAVRDRLLASWSTMHGAALLLIEGRLQRFYLGATDTERMIDYIVKRHLKFSVKLAPKKSSRNRLETLS